MDTPTLQGFIAETADYVVRTLPPEDWAKLPYQTLPNPEFAFVVVVEEKATGKILASWTAMTCTFLEGLHIHAERHGLQRSIADLLLAGMFSMLSALDVKHPLTIADDPAILAMARKAGFSPIAGTLLVLE